jgi:hypothetical protein
MAWSSSTPALILESCSRLWGVWRRACTELLVVTILIVAAGLLDELWLHSSPVALGAGERLSDGVPPLNRKPLGARANELVTNVRYA